MAIKIKSTKSEISQEDIDRLESGVRGIVPNDYVKFLLFNNGGIPEVNVFDIKQIKNSSGITKFLNCREILSEKVKLGNRIPTMTIPIAYAEGGNFVCLCLEGERKGVYFWDHELEDEEDNLPSWKNMFYLALTFNEFLKTLKLFDPNEIKLRPEQIISVKTTPALLEIIRQEQEEIRKKTD